MKKHFPPFILSVYPHLKIYNGFLRPGLIEDYAIVDNDHKIINLKKHE